MGIYAIFSFWGTLAWGQAVPLSPHLYHEPVLTAPSDQALEISLITEEGIREIASASLLWRRPGGEFRSADMEPVPGGLAYTIPAEDVRPAYLEYAILVYFADGGSASFPISDPLMSPQVISVFEGAAPQVERQPKRVGPEFILLYPQEGDLIFEPEVRIVVSIFDPDSLFDPSTLDVFLDGDTTTVKELTHSFLLVEVAGLKPGKHTVTLRSRTYSGDFNPDFTWSFRTAAAGEERPLTTFAWAFTGEGAQEDFGGEAEGIARADFRARGKVSRMDYTARCFLTSEEAWDRQPRNRFFFGLRGEHFHLNLGDTYPIFSDLVLSGKRVRGVHLGAHTSRFYLVGVFGEVRKPIEDSTYRRYLLGIRPYYAAPGGATLGLSLLKVKDELGSIAEATVSPQDNVVVGLDFTWPFLARRLEWSFDAAFSLTAQDIRGGSVDPEALEDADIEIPFDPEPWEPIIIINESLLPPNPLEGGSLAWMTKLALRQSGHYAALSYRNIAPSYYSLGNPFLQNDLSSWSLTDQFSLWKRCVFVNVGLNQQRDNTRHTKSTTTTRTGGWITLAVYPVAPAPSATLALNLNRNKNDMDVVDTNVSNGDTLYLDQRRNDNSRTIGASLTQRLLLFDRRHDLSLSFNQSDFIDDIEDRPPDFSDLNSHSTNLGAIWRTDISLDIIVSGVYSYYSSEIGDLDYTYHQIGATYDGRYLNRDLRVLLGGYRRTGEEDLNRWQLDLRADWEFYPKHALRADASRFFNDNTEDEGVYRIYYFKRF